jgi:hypothetical protein
MKIVPRKCAEHQGGAMKKVRDVVVVALVCLLASNLLASEHMFMGYDPISQKMQAIVRSDAPFHTVVTYTQSNPNGFIGDVNVTPATPLEHWGEAVLTPSDPARATDIPDGSFNVITATAQLFNDQDEYIGTVTATDTLMVAPGTGHYIYNSDFVPVLPDTIRAGSAFCAHINHGTFFVPIKCDYLNGTLPDPDSVEVYVANGCSDPAHCNEDCQPLALWEDFSSQIRVRVGCRIFLVMTYCGEDQGCICIWRSDDKLPVEISAFSAQAGDNQVLLNWRTASESNLQTFRVTRSLTPDGIGEVVGAVSAHNSPTGAAYTLTDNNAVNGTTYYYKLHVIDVAGHSAYYNVGGQAVVASAMPRSGAAPVTEFAMAQNYPNPFNSQTTFSFAIPNAERVTLKVYDLLGREVATVIDKDLAANSYTINWSAEGLATGVYMYKMNAGSFSATRKLLFVK